MHDILVEALAFFGIVLCGFAIIAFAIRADILIGAAP
jgi:hypothetical protein